MTTPSPDRPTLWQRTTTRRFLIWFFNPEGWRRSRTVRFLKWLFSWRTIRRTLKAIAAIVIVLAVIYFAALYAPNRRLRQAYAALEKDGRPMKVEDVIPPKVPDSENGALLIQAAVAELEAKTVGNESLVSRLDSLAAKISWAGRSSDPEAVTNDQEFQKLLALDVVAQALRKVEEGADKPKCNGSLTIGAFGQTGPKVFLKYVYFCP